MKILEHYLECLTKSDLFNKLAMSNVVTYKTPEDLKKGLLRFDKYPFNKKFLFVLPDEQIAGFHTVGMKFPINIYFYDINGKLDSFKLNMGPGIKSIRSKNKVKYVVEIPL
jgi:uncharacterized membrane protein (UPF0127 family)